MVRFEYVRGRREDVQKIPVRYEKLVGLVAKLYMKLNVAVYKMSGGRLMNKGPVNGAFVFPTRPVEDQFYGDRSGQFRDPFGHIWGVATRLLDA